MKKLVYGNNQKGFTLVEILVAISILALIATASVPNLRKFNRSQVLQNTASDLARVLREAQSSGNSRTSCSDTLTPKEWYVTIRSNGYDLKVDCYNKAVLPAGTPIPQTRYLPSANSLAGITFVVTSLGPIVNNCPLPTRVHFSSELSTFGPDRFQTTSFDCNNNLDYRLAITLSSSGVPNQYICIDKGGAIYATSKICWA